MMAFVRELCAYEKILRFLFFASNPKGSKRKQRILRMNQIVNFILQDKRKKN
jgi:hypothetical protein